MQMLTSKKNMFPIVLDVIMRYGVPLVVFIFCVIFTLIEPRFASSYNIINVLRQSSILMILALGQMMPLIVGGIDVSVGSMIGATSVITGYSVISFGFLPGIFIGVIFGTLLGSINGFLIAKFNVNAFVITLGMLSAARGLALVLSKGRPIFDGIPDNFCVLGSGYVGPIPIPVIIALIIFLIIYIFMDRIETGRHLYAVGSNPEASRLSGISIFKIRFLAYSLSGFFAGIAGVILSSRVNSGQPNLAAGIELDAIAAAVIGGVAIGGGRGTVFGVLWGVMLLGILRNGLNLSNVSSYLQLMITGIIVMAAIIVDRLRHGKED